MYILEQSVAKYVNKYAQNMWYIRQIHDYSWSNSSLNNLKTMVGKSQEYRDTGLYQEAGPSWLFSANLHISGTRPSQWRDCLCQVICIRNYRAFSWQMLAWEGQHTISSYAPGQLVLGFVKKQAEHHVKIHTVSSPQASVSIPASKVPALTCLGDVLQL